VKVKVKAVHHVYYGGKAYKPGEEFEVEKAVLEATPIGMEPVPGGKKDEPKVKPDKKK